MFPLLFIFIAVLSVRKRSIRKRSVRGGFRVTVGRSRGRSLRLPKFQKLRAQTSRLRKSVPILISIK